MAKMEITLSGRKVYWTITENTAIMLIQNLVSALGPAKEG